MDLEKEKAAETQNKTATDAASADGADNKGEGKDDGQVVLTQKEKEIEERIKTKSTQLEQLEESTKIESEKLKAIRDEKRALGQSITPQEIVDQGNSSEEATEDTKKTALRIFTKTHPEYAAENDPGLVKFKELNSHFLRYRVGSTIEQVIDDLEYIHKNHMAPKTTTTSVVTPPDGDPGNTSSVTTQTKQSSALSRKLNKYEQAAANSYPGGEKLYREHLAKIE